MHRRRYNRGAAGRAPFVVRALHDTGSLLTDQALSFIPLGSETGEFPRREAHNVVVTGGMMTTQTPLPSREQAWALLCEYTSSDSLRKHALGVEAAMCAYARHYGEDEERWGLVGLLHDFDYERYPSREDHPRKGSEILAAQGYPDDIRYAILCHAPYLGLERQSRMDKAILAVDELVGFITAVALVQPNKRLTEVKVSSVKKKLKDKAFARSVIREDIYLGMTDLGVMLDDHVAFVMQAMLPIADQLGL
jgi:predicted hydrolase (HD superfamily)